MGLEPGQRFRRDWRQTDGHLRFGFSL